MLLVLALTISILIVTVSYLNKLSKKKDTSNHVNEELTKYFMLSPNSPPQVAYKQLLSAASSYLSSSEEIERQIVNILPLYKDRLVSDEYYENLNNISKELELEKMVIESESEILKKGSKEQLFQEARKNKSKIVSMKIYEDQYFNHKREVLENELKKKLINV
ncbi:hypothetical protein NGRA_0829 [Nosema granulosis]|uniref:Uncharacterized protein n=1 Tax=Nosema granulosis TaxID=83296 RepID=A0A9P6KZY8_9MICR|nr:hypothetical protein NGRA_0829 [Nosema granulosis]